MINEITSEVYQHVLAQKELDVNFQPIVSISKRSMIGFESLLRTFYHGEFISPESLFSYARDCDSAVVLDQICQKKALQRYHENQCHKLLFINFETSLLEYYLENIEPIIEHIDSLGIPRGKVVIEINEKSTDSNSKLVELIEVCREAGFLIALDDVGAGHSNLHRVVLARPDIVKVDRSVISQIDKDYYKQSVMKAITELCQKIGAITIAEGAEEESEVVACVNCGVDWFQGYFFAKALEPSIIKAQSFNDLCTTISYHYQKEMLGQMSALAHIVRSRKKLFHMLTSYVMQYEMTQVDEVLINYLHTFPEIECAYLINDQGMQITNTLFNPHAAFKNKDLFSPMKKGDYHISKAFYNYAIRKKHKVYVSDPYISSATGNYCQTLSKYLQTKDGVSIIFCVDFLIPESI